MAPRGVQHNQALRDATRARILKAALELFSRHGYAGTSVRLVADKAGVAVGLIYSHVKSKDGLLVALFEQSMVDVQYSFTLADRGTTPNQRLELLLRGALTVMEQNQAFWRLSYGVRMQPDVVRGLGKRLGVWTTQVHQVLRGYLKDAGVPNPDVEARVLFGVIDGVCQHYVLDPEHYPLRDVEDALVARFVPRPVHGGKKR